MAETKASDNWDIIKDRHVIVEDVKMIKLPSWAQAILTASNILVLIIALCGNLAAILVVLRSRLSKMSTRFFLVSLALSDLILASTTMPIDLGKLTDKYHSWIFGNFMCETIAAVQTHFIMMSSFCLFAIAVERYLTVMRSVKVSKLGPIWEARLPYILFFLTWTIPFGCSIPMLWGYQQWSLWVMVKVDGVNVTTYRVDSNLTYYLCQQTEDFNGNGIWYISVGAIFFALLIAFLFCYLSIIVFVKTHGSNFRQNHSQGQTSSSNNVTTTGAHSNLSHSPLTTHGRQRRTVRLVMGLILIFVICRAPNWIFLIIINLHEIKKNVANTCVLYFLHLLGSINTAVSPFVYAIWNDSLRTTDIHKKRGSGCCCLGSSLEWISSSSSFGRIFVIGKGNTYDFTSQSRVFQTNSTQKYFLSEKNAPSLTSTAGMVQFNLSRSYCGL